GIPVSTESAHSKVTLVDANTVLADPSVLAELRAAAAMGCTVIFWGVTPENIPRVTGLLPLPLEVFPHSATSLIHNESDPRVGSIAYKDLYFSENTDSKVIMKYGLRGPWVERGTILLQACRTDWTRGNNGGMMRSERETTAAPCLVEYQDGPGRYLACSLDLTVMTPAHFRLLGQLFKNLGVSVQPVTAKRGDLLDQTQVLIRALTWEQSAAAAPEALMEDTLGGETSLQPEAEMVSGGASWKVKNAQNGSFRFTAPGQGTTGNRGGIGYLSFWVQCPQPLDEIMTDPNVPEVGFKFSSGGGCKLWLNGREQFFSAPAVTNGLLEKLPLKKGWNHFLIKLAVGSPATGFSGRLISKHYDLLSGMKSALNPYSAKANFYTIEHTDPEIKYDPAWGLQGDGWYESFTPGAKAKFKFFGTGFALKGRVGPDGGRARLTIDGQVQKEINYQRAENNRRVELFSQAGFPAGEHEVTVEVLSGRVTVGPYDQWERY
ncbi:MAG TPA: hypothetical protein VF607_08180, partial [Verrucomicrobiae bacterium]